MGGNAIPDARRISTLEFQTLVTELLPILRQSYSHTYVPLFLNNKESHGDIDIIVCLPLNSNHRGQLKDQLNSKYMVTNGNTCSYEYQGVQIDVSVHSAENFVMTCFYKNYGDLSGLIGMITRRVGLIYGMDGLRLRCHLKDGELINDIKQNSDYNHEINLSKNPETIFNFLGLSYQRYNQSFANEVELVEFLSHSHYFHASHYYPEVHTRGDHRNRTKRLSNILMRQLIKDQPNLPQNILPTYVEMVKLATTYFHCQTQIEVFKIENRIHQTCKQRLNGQLVGKLSGLKLQDLGNLMKHIHHIVSTEDIVNMSEDIWFETLQNIISTYLYMNHM